jgi:DNA adenine methylase
VGKSVAKEWADLPEKIMRVTRRMQGVHIENRPALDMLRRYRGPEVVVFDDPPYMRKSVHGERSVLYRHEMMEPEQHEESLAESLLHPGPYLLCSYRNGLYDRVLLGAGWTVVEAQTIAEHGQRRVEALYLNPAAAASRPREQLSFGRDT